MTQGVSSNLNRSSSGYERSGPQCRSLVPKWALQVSTEWVSSNLKRSSSGYERSGPQC